MRPKLIPWAIRKVHGVDAKAEQRMTPGREPFRDDRSDIVAVGLRLHCAGHFATPPMRRPCQALALLRTIAYIAVDCMVDDMKINERCSIVRIRGNVEIRQITHWHCEHLLSFAFPTFVTHHEQRSDVSSSL